MSLLLNRRYLFLLLYFLVLLAPAGYLPLTESTEARYGEIAREMVVSGNYLEPTFNGIKHFHKPPLTYWLIAAGFKLFGVNDFGARFFGAVAAALAVAALFGMARILLQTQKQALTAALIGASSGLFLAVSRIAATDIYLTCFTFLAQFFLFRQIYGRKSSANAPLYALFLALGFLTKGPIVFLFTLLPYLVAKLVDTQHRHVFSGRQIVTATAVFLAVSLPWYLMVSAANPGLLDYFIKVQTVDRVVTDRFHRYEPPWYFLAVFLGTFLPYVFFFLRGVLQLRSLDRRLRILPIYVAVPFFVFSLAQSKHATYLLPLFGVAAVFTADLLLREDLRRLRLLSLAVLALFVLAPAAGFFWPPLQPYRFFLAAFCLPALALFALAVRDRHREAFALWVAAVLLVFASAGHTAFALADTQFKGYERMVRSIDRLDPGHRNRILVYDDFLPSVSFYRGELAAMALKDDREIQFQNDADFMRTYLPTRADVRRFLQDRPRFFLIGKPVQVAGFAAEFACDCREIFGQRKHSAYLCAPAE